MKIDAFAHISPVRYLERVEEILAGPGASAAVREHGPWLREDPVLHHTNGPDIVAASKAALAKATGAMGDWFGILPKAGCDVEETQSGAIAFYFPPAKDGSRGGVFFMNTSDPQGWGRTHLGCGRWASTVCTSGSSRPPSR